MPDTLSRTERSESAPADDIADQIIERLGPRLVVGAPLGLGKANRILDALYERALRDSRIHLVVHTALGLVPPHSTSALEARLRDPINDRLYGGYAAPQVIVDLHGDDLPENVVVHSFFFQTGAMLGNARGRRDRINANYSDVGRRVSELELDVFVQMVAPGETSEDPLSLSCNPDLTLAVIEHFEHRRDRGDDVMMCAEVNRNLPWIGGDAAIDRTVFDTVLETAPPDPALFVLPNMPASIADHSIAARAARLIPDGGTIQLGIGALSDAVAWMLMVRHSQPDRYARLVADLRKADRRDDDHDPLDVLGGDEAFTEGLYASSEMFVPGLLELFEAGILSRRVYDDIDVQRRALDGEEPDGEGHVAHAGFFIGPGDFYERLRTMDSDRRATISMTGIGRVNTLDDDQELRVLQRQGARFVNTAMNVTLTGATASDTLDNGRVVSGVGGQFDFVEMARRLPGARSIILLRAVRDDGAIHSNIVLDHRHVTSPAHLRDIVVTEYGVADLRDRSDGEVAQRLIEIADSRFQPQLVEQAQASGRVAPDYVVPPHRRSNTPESLRQRWRGHEELGPDLPFDSELHDDEIQLGRALRHLDGLRRHRRINSVVLRALAAFVFPPRRCQPLLDRMGLDTPEGFIEHLQRRLVAYGLAATGALDPTESIRRRPPLESEPVEKSMSEFSSDRVRPVGADGRESPAAQVTSQT